MAYIQYDTCTISFVQTIDTANIKNIERDLHVFSKKY